MTDLKRLLDEATPLPWIRLWELLNVHAPGHDDLFGQLVPSIHHPGSREAQANIDLAVAAVNALPDLLAAVEALERCIEGFQTVEQWQEARAVLRRFREAVPS